MMEKTQTKPLTAAQQRQRDKKRRTWLRAGVQLFFFVSMPGAFVAGFSGVKQIFLHIGAGEVLTADSFTLSLLGLCGFTLLFDRFSADTPAPLAAWVMPSGHCPGLSRKNCSTAKSSSVCRSGRCFGGRRSNICCWRGWWRCM